MKDDIIINKIEVIKRCIKRVEEEYDNNILNLEILKNILEKHLYDSIKFSKCILEK